MPGTAAPSPGSFQRPIARLISAGHDVLCLTLPRQYSAVYNSAWLGAQEFGLGAGACGGFGLDQPGHGGASDRGGQTCSVGRRPRGGTACRRKRARPHVGDFRARHAGMGAAGRPHGSHNASDRETGAHLQRETDRRDGRRRPAFAGSCPFIQGALLRLEDEVRSRLPVEILAAAYTRGRDAAVELAGRLAGLVNSGAGGYHVAGSGSGCCHAMPAPMPWARWWCVPNGRNRSKETRCG